jgi:hypothetical protein
MGKAFSTNKEIRNEHDILVNHCEVIDCQQDEGVDGSIILKWVWMKQCVK